MSLHEYNTRIKKSDFQEALANLEQNIANSIISVKTELKEEINNLKDVTIKRIQDENVILWDRCSNLEQKLVEFEYSTNNLEQYGRRNNIIISGIPDSINVNQLEESLKFLLTLMLMWQAMILKLAIGSVRKIPELAALKLLFVL